MFAMTYKEPFEGFLRKLWAQIRPDSIDDRTCDDQVLFHYVRIPPVGIMKDKMTKVISCELPADVS